MTSSMTAHAMVIPLTLYRVLTQPPVHGIVACDYKQYYNVTEKQSFLNVSVILNTQLFICSILN